MAALNAIALLLTIAASHVGNVVGAFHSGLRPPWRETATRHPVSIARNRGVFAEGLQQDPWKGSEERGGERDAFPSLVGEQAASGGETENLLTSNGDHHAMLKTDDGDSSIVRLDTKGRDGEPSPRHGKEGTPTATATLAGRGPPSSASSTRMRDYRSELMSMTRPENFPGVVLFHLLGTWLAVPAGPSQLQLFRRLLRSPAMTVTLVALLLTSSTSMLVNDYYDYKLGHDAMKPNKPMRRVPLIVVKRFVSYLYAAALVCAALVPGVPARLMVVLGLISTFLYTEHLKPVTWVKNAVCACLMALSPLTSGLAAASTLGMTPPATAILTAPAAVAAAIPSMWPLARLVGMLFVGFLGREITMDMNDVQDDTAHSIRTVPVAYGYRFASSVAWACSLGVAALSLSGPLLALVRGGWSFTPTLIRRLVFASVGSMAQLRRFWQVLRSEGRDAGIVDAAIQEGLLSVVLILASFV